MNIGVIFGSVSTEHEVSVASAYGIMQGLTKHTNHRIFPIYINKDGKWVHEKDFLKIENLKDLVYKDYSKYNLDIDFSKTGKLVLKQKKGFFSAESLELDIIFPILHGKNGEDGSIQGICQLLRVPCISPGVLSSSLGMNKIAMKNIFSANDIPIVKHVICKNGEMNIEDIEKIGYPIFVKPANLGSSIGVSKVDNRKDLEQAIEVAYYYDDQIICEKGVENLVELNCAIMPDQEKIIISFVEKPKTSSEFLSFDEKYINEGGSIQGAKAKVEIPANIPETVRDRIWELAKKIANIMFVDGGAPRIDFMRDSVNDIIYVNEINTIPGSLMINLWKESGVEPAMFFEKLINNAVYQNKKQNEKSTNFESNIIDLTMNFRK